MHELMLLRHAEAEPGKDDRARSLSMRGRDEAAAAGRWLKAHRRLPERVLCSPAMRTVQTAELVLDIAAPELAIELSEAIYEATPGELLALLDQHADAGSVLLIGHNPGLERLVALMVEGRSDDFRGMPPAGIAVLHLDDALEPGRARLDAFWSP
ncbi:SixA phosphatase family protein [Aerosticca soli]|nr:histidine phosphatase family protein [Aerosticca soli]